MALELRRNFSRHNFYILSIPGIPDCLPVVGTVAALSRTDAASLSFFPIFFVQRVLEFIPLPGDA